MSDKVCAAFVHVFTACGAVLALLAVIAISQQRWEAVFAWLGLALIVDGVDGALARHFEVKRHLPRFDGAVLDLIIDYLTYVFIPVLALLAGEYLAGPAGFAVAALILLSALYHFSDRDSKAEDNTFVGFPALWNLVAFLIFAADASSPVTTIAALVLVAMTFLPWPWLHPLRVKRLRWLTVTVVIVSAVTAVSVVAGGFPAGPWQVGLMLAAAAYAILLPLVWTKSNF